MRFYLQLTSSVLVHGEEGEGCLREMVFLIHMNIFLSFFASLFFNFLGKRLDALMIDDKEVEEQ